MIRRPPRSTPLYSSAASDVYKRQCLYYSLCIIQLSDFGAIRKGLAHQVYRSQARTNFPSASRCCPSYPVERPHFATLTRARMDRSYANTHSVPLTTLRARQSHVDVAVGTRSTWSWGLQRRQIDAELDQRHTFPASRHHCDCLLYTSPSPRDVEESRMPSSA